MCECVRDALMRGLFMIGAVVSYLCHNEDGEEGYE